MAKKKSLTPYRKRFCLLYIQNGRNASAAYREIFPNARTSTVRQQAYLMIHEPEVEAEIERLTQEQLTREQMGADEALARMARIARADPADLIWKPGETDSGGNQTTPGEIKPLYEMPEAVRSCIKSLSWERDDHGRLYPKFSFWNKDLQLTNIGKHHKLLNESVDVNVQLGFAEKLRRAREKRLGSGNKK